ncbi:MAG TPA: error-prone DNA polymerase [Polyangiaceae bacterium]
MFAELLATSCFSFLRGASHPHELVVQARELGLAALALCDRDGLYGSVRALAQARESKQRVIVGAELTLEATNTQSSRRRRKQSSKKPAPTLALLCENKRGYANLCRLLTLSHADRAKGESALSLSWLEEHAEGLFALIPAPKSPGDATTPQDELFLAVKHAFGARSAIAMYRYHDGFDGTRLAAVLDWSARFQMDAIASARPLYHHCERKQLCDVLHAIRLGLTLDDAGRALLGNSEACLRGEREMKELFPRHLAWVERAGEIGETLQFQLDELCYQFPCRLEPNECADQKLRRLTFEGLARRYPQGTGANLLTQIEKELALIQERQVASYFLSTWEVVEIARDKQILCQGRGSAANSAVCYALGITAVDPEHSNLLFERFLSNERSEPPDIDVDFEHERREEVIQEIYARYGRENAAMVSEVICYRGKSAVREVGKAFGFSLEQIARLSGTIIRWESAEVNAARLAEMGFDPRDERLQKVQEYARALSGFPRHLSIHVGGFVLSASPLCEVAPIEPARMPERTVVPWDKDDLELLGFYKIDVLGLGMLTAIRKSLELVHADGDLGGERDSHFDPLEVVTRIEADDRAVYDMVSRGDTVGVFQIESRAQMAMLPRLRPKNFYDLVIEVAIVRPGPIQGGMVHPYLRRRNKEEEIKTPHPSLQPILERTLGVPLFQEQVMQIAIVGAGYSGGEADQLRRDMAAWKKSGKLLRHRQRLLDGFARNGIPLDFGAALFEQIKGFGDYGFPESHAASFALLVYSSSWLKAHYPAHFACALLNAQPMGFYSASTIVQDAARHGAEIRDVDVMRSAWDSTLEVAAPTANSTQRKPRALRLGFRQVKGFEEVTAQRLVSLRKGRPFCSFEDFIARVALRQDELELLAEAGAFETLLPGRRQALWQARAPRVPGLFNAVPQTEARAELPVLPALGALLLDYEHKRLSVVDHPMRHVRKRLSTRKLCRSCELPEKDQGQYVSVAGMVICRQQPGTASGVVFITLEDEWGFINLVLWRRVFERFRMQARHASILLAEGKIERQPRPAEKRAEPGEGAIIHVIVESVERLDMAEQSIPRMSRDFH